ncbi:MAG: hypothetical protein J2P36_13425 [Ktedonobacteraceae bacterium]|nr:hypothetical protein [Ktedonobacteraceae bacterium]
MTLSDTLPFALGFSVRRIDYFLGTMIMVVAISAVSAMALLLLSVVEHDLAMGWGTALHFFDLPYVNDGSLIGQFWIYFSAMIHLYLLGFVISSLYYRFGRKGMYIFFIAVFLCFSLAGYLLTYFNQWGVIFGWLVQHSAFELALWAFPMTVGYALLSLLLLRKATV